ncbi:MAG: hypothetical protein ACODAJ_02665 [Planctomycetota bacterium]
MLRIRREQMAALSEHMARQFEQRMVAHLRQRFPQQTQDLDEPALHAQVHEGIERAKGYGITQEDDVRRFLEYQALLGADFDTSRPWAASVLSDDSLAGTEKMDRIDAYHTFAVREPRP